jgi:PAS domain S-box-containing protein
MLGAGFGLVATVLATNLVVSILALWRLQANNSVVLDSARQFRLLEATLSAIKDAESGQRAFLLTGEESYLRPYVASLGVLGEDLSRLRDSADEQGGRGEIDSLDRVVKEKVRELGDTVSLHRSGRVDAARDVVKTGLGVRLMEEIRDRFRALEDREGDRLAGRVEASRTALHRTTATLAIASLATLALCVLLGLAVFRHLAVVRRSEALLRHQSERWRVTLASIGDGVIVTDDQERVTFVNPVAESLCGISGAGVEGQPLGAVYRIVAEAPPQPASDQAGRAMRDATSSVGPEGDASGRGRHSLVAADGTRRPIQETVAPIRDEGGGRAGAVLVFRDDSDRHDRERRLVEESRRKDELLAMLAHELRNPLASILSASEVLYLSESAADLGWACEVIGREVRQLSRSLDDLLDVSRMTRDLIELRKEWIDAVPVLARAVTAIRPLAEGRAIRLKTSFSHPSLWLEADPARLDQILSNLLGNAARYTPEGGEIRVTAGIVDTQIVIRVIDNGIGIAGDVLPSVFDLFTQGERTLARSEGGLGIGLTIVKKLVELHAGSVSARSDGPGMGSTFTVRLPAAKENPVDTMASHAWPGQGENAERSRILIVDDNKDLATSLARLLRILGHEVEVVYDGRKGIEIARSYRPRVVLLDIGLPNLDGYQVARTLRQEGFNDTMIIAVSGYGQEEDRKRSRDAGMDYHLTKPVDFKTIAALIAQPN